MGAKINSMVNDEFWLHSCAFLLVHSNYRQKKLLIIPATVSFYHLVQCFVVLLQEGTLDFDEVVLK